jgi:hypothetical protein
VLFIVLPRALILFPIHPSENPKPAPLILRKFPDVKVAIFIGQFPLAVHFPKPPVSSIHPTAGPLKNPLKISPKKTYMALHVIVQKIASVFRLIHPFQNTIALSHTTIILS